MQLFTPFADLILHFIFERSVKVVISPTPMTASAPFSSRVVVWILYVRPKSVSGTMYSYLKLGWFISTPYSIEVWPTLHSLKPFGNLKLVQFQQRLLRYQPVDCTSHTRCLSVYQPLYVVQRSEIRPHSYSLSPYYYSVENIGLATAYISSAYISSRWYEAGPIYS